MARVFLFVTMLGSFLSFGCQADHDAEVLERNKAIVRRTHSEVFTQGNMQVVDELYASDYVGHWTGREPTIGLEEFKIFLKSARARVPDHSEEIEQIVAEGDLVVTRFSSRGTFKGEPGVPPDGTKTDIEEIAIHRIVDGKIAEQWTVRDQLRALQQLGTLCPPLEGGGQQ